MKKCFISPAAVFALVLLLACLGTSQGLASMTVQSLSGPVTATEISSFKTFMATQSPPTAQTYDNTLADGTAGMNCEALGLMYEVTNDPAILNEMISFADSFIALRNDYTDRRVMWTGQVEPVWLTTATTSGDPGYAGCENNDIVGHIAYCAKLILQSPALWNTTVPDGNPHGYGVTYLQRAQTYVTRMEQVESQYMNPWFIDTSTDRIKDSTQVDPRFSALGQSTTAWNRQMMFINGWQRLSECHAILGDSPANVAFYDAICRASVSWFQTEWQNTTGGGQPAYLWQYAPSHAGGNEEMNLHAAYDMWGLGRAYDAGKYGMTQPLLRPFAETLRYIIYQQGTSYTFAEWVNGDTSKTRNYIYPEWMYIAAWDPCTFSIMAQADINQGSQGSTAIFDALILWVKNARYLGIYPSNCDGADFSIYSPWVENLTSGSSTNYPVTITPLFGFGAGAVSLSMSGLPGGVTASFSAGANSTLTISASGSVASGVYAATISGTGSGITRTLPITLVVTNTGVPNFTISASPSSQNTTIGTGTSYTVNVGSVDGFSGTVALSASGLPANTTAAFSPASVAGGSGTSTLTITAATNAPHGNFTVTIAGVSGSLNNSTTVTLVLNDFSLAATPGSQTVTAGNGTNYSVSVGTVNGFAGTVTLSAAGLPAGASASFNPTSVSAPGSSTLTVTTLNSTPAGTNTLTITGASGNLLHSTTATLTVTSAPAGSFSLSATPTSQTVTEGGGASYTITVTSSNGFTGTVNLGVGGMGVGTTANFSPASITGGSGSSTLTVTTTSATPGANGYTLMVTGTSGSLTNTVGLNLTVNPPSPGGPLPGGWTDTDVGGPLYLPGSAGYTNGLFTVNGSGADIWGVGDEFNYAYQSVNGDETLVAQVAGLQNSDPWARAGLMFRETTSSNATYVGLYVTIGNGVSMQYRNGTGTSAVDFARQTGLTAPYWVKLIRSGNTFTGYSSPDGVTWTQAGSTNVTMATSATAGLVVCSHNFYQINTATFTNVSFTAPDFTISASPSSQTVTAGGNTNFTATVTALNGFGGNVALTVAGLPSGATASYNPASVSGSGTSTLTITTTNTMPASTNTLTITGTSGSLLHTATVTLVVNPAVTWTEINDTSASITYSSGWTYGTNRNLGDYNNDVHYTTGASNYAQFTFTGTGIQYITETYTDEGNVDVYLDGTYQTTVNCNSSTRQSQAVVYSNTGLSAGSHTIKVVKNSGTYMLVDAFAYVAAAPAPDFTISAAPGSQTVTAGANTTYTATISALNGFAGNVALTVSGLPSGATASFSPASVSGSGSSTLTVTTTNIMGASTNRLTITGTSGSLVHTATVTLIVNPAVWTLVNDTDAGITYSSTGWSYSATRGYGDYQDDVHYTRTAANYAQYTFTGTSAEYITEMNTDEGNVDVYIDGTFQTTVNCNAASRQAQVVMYSTSSLAYGSHTIKVVKNSGTYMLVDAFGYR